jgi:(p)ppGpp synthase/HD superfamily hydrolase
VVRDRTGRSYEIQIRTSLMHRTAVRGSAAHRRYKERSTGARVADTAR